MVDWIPAPSNMSLIEGRVGFAEDMMMRECNKEGDGKENVKRNGECW
jgi:hypothetical protein